jgi:hypothetical protein
VPVACLLQEVIKEREESFKEDSPLQVKRHLQATAEGEN